jgi:sugar O-acyltransferase (sialic acid O-acetyltransferase NeuD family)
MTAATPLDLLIIGAGGASREIAWAVEETNALAPRWNLLGFLDDNPSLHSERIHGYPVLGGLDALPNFPTAQVIIGIASYKSRTVRKRIVDRIALPADRFATVIAPTARVSRHAVVGCGSAILHGATIGTDAVIGDHVIIGSSCVVGHDARLHHYVTLAAAAVASGSSLLHSEVYVGARAVIRDGLTIGEGALVALGAAVFHDVAPGDTVIGNPAASLRKRNRIPK